MKRALLLAQAAVLLLGTVTALPQRAPAVHAQAASGPTVLRSYGPHAPVMRRVAVHHTRPAAAKAPAKAPAKPAAAPAAVPQDRVARAVARIPGYRPGAAEWVVSWKFGGHWGAADWYANRVYLCPCIPDERLYDVVVHEWSHLLQVQVYGGSVPATVAALNGWFGGSGLTGAERAADCMAKALGASWTHYTSCPDAHWQQGARLLLAGQRLAS